MQLGPTIRLPARRAFVTIALFPHPSLGAAFSKARADDADGRHLLRQAVVDHGLDVQGRDDHDGEVNWTGYLADAGVGLQANEFRGCWMNGNDRARELRLDQVVQDLGADLPALAAGANDRHHPRRKERSEIARVRSLMLVGFHGASHPSSAQTAPGPRLR